MKGRKKIAALDWSQCRAVESVPGRLDGAWVFRNTRLPVSAVFENLAAGASIDDIIAQLAITRVQINAVLEFAARSLDRRLYGLREKRVKKRSRPASPPPEPARVERADSEIAVLAQKQRAAELPHEPPILGAYQLSALRAVVSGSPDALAIVNSFTLDVLGRMRLLSRGKGQKGKAAWRLTDEGRRALARADKRA
ncbi:MAG TPA: DUF433 domain-containing protein [Xanthobacteraceae bacterium]|nr:DUF433 domain-containing protein [Xanthobacteraceae bacterium]